MSFKLKLVGYFVLLSMLPLAAAFTGFSGVVERSETRVVDAELGSQLRTALAAYEEELAAAERRAAAAARDPGLQRALARRDAAALRRILAPQELRVTSGDLRVGRAHANAAERAVVVLASAQDGGAELGRVIASVPLDAALARRLARRSTLGSREELVLAAGGRVVAASGRLHGPLDLRAAAATVELAGGEYRVRAAGTGDGTVLAAVAPQARIDAATADARRRLLFTLAAALVLVALVAYVEGRSIVLALRRLVRAANGFAEGRLDERVPVSGGAHDEFATLARSFNAMAQQLQQRVADLEAERRRLDEATLRFGHALAATHDVDRLLRTIVGTAVEATRAAGGVLNARGGEVVEFGDPGRGTARIELPLAAGQHDFGTLVLTGERFDDGEVETATLLVRHAAIALENASLHRVLERQALVDELTELPNRRRAEEALGAELARAKRFETPVALVLADLDGFKEVNDRLGHPAGDVVLREFAAVVRETVREIDIAARWGGEEFVLLLPGADAEAASRVADRVRRAFAERTIVAPDGTPVVVTASLGVAAYPAAGTPSALVAAADGALYAAKRAGKNRVARAPEAALHA